MKLPQRTKSYEKAIVAGMNDHLAKPFQKEKLYEMMKYL